MHLKNTERRGFLEHTRPGFGIEFGTSLLQFERVRTIRASERAAMRQLGEQAEWIGRALRRRIHYFPFGRMILSENRCPLFGIMRRSPSIACRPARRSAPRHRS